MRGSTLVLPFISARRLTASSSTTSSKGEWASSATLFAVYLANPVSRTGVERMLRERSAIGLIFDENITACSRGTGAVISHGPIRTTPKQPGVPSPRQPAMHTMNVVATLQPSSRQPGDQGPYRAHSRAELGVGEDIHSARQGHVGWRRFRFLREAAVLRRLA